MYSMNLTFSIAEQTRLQGLGVGLVYLFGSHAEGTSGPLSDIDLGIVFADPNISRGNTLSIYSQLYDLFSNNTHSENLDIVLLERASLELRFDVVRYGKLLFFISLEFKDKFEHHTLMLYADFKPILNQFDQAVLSRI